MAARSCPSECAIVAGAAHANPPDHPHGLRLGRGAAARQHDRLTRAATPRKHRAHRREPGLHPLSHRQLGAGADPRRQAASTWLGCKQSTEPGACLRPNVLLDIPVSRTYPAHGTQGRCRSPPTNGRFGASRPASETSPRNRSQARMSGHNVRSRILGDSGDGAGRHGGVSAG
jgi:hypothetical protein